MRGALTGDTLFATILLTRQAASELILVVEGDDDHFLFTAHINENHVRLLQGAGGKESVLRAARIADERRVNGVRFFVDSDYDRMANPPVAYPPNVIASTNHDALMDVLLSGEALLGRVIDTHSRSARRSETAEFETSEAVREAFDLAAALAPLRIANDAQGWGLRLRDFPFGSISSITSAPTQIAALAVGRSDTRLTSAQIVEEMTQVGMDLARYQTGELVGDHDFFGALSRVLREHGVTAGARSLATAFLAGLLCAHLGSTDWYLDLVSWGTANSKSTFACPCAA